MASGNMKIRIITECIQQLIIKLINVICLPSLSFSPRNSHLHRCFFWIPLTVCANTFNYAHVGTWKLTSIQLASSCLSYMFPLYECCCRAGWVPNSPGSPGCHSILPSHLIWSQIYPLLLFLFFYPLLSLIFGLSTFCRSNSSSSLWGLQHKPPISSETRAKGPI